MTYRAIAGHARVKALLAGAVARSTVPPTLLFAGPHGVGKSLVAGATAAAMNCIEPVRGLPGLAIDSCGTCRVCDRIARGVHMDVLRLDPDDKASIKVDVVRDMLERTGFRPFEGRRRVVIVREADTLEPHAQNALLKSLEEPPPGTVFILTTAIPGALLPTVRSRCMRLRFPALSDADVAAVLERDHGFEAEKARTAAALSEGSVGHALALGSTDLAVMRELALDLLRQAARGSLSTRLQVAAAIVGPAKKERPREEIALVLRLVASMLRDIELLNTSGDPHALANALSKKELAALTRSFSGDCARDAFAFVDRAVAALQRNAGTKVVTDWLASQI